MDVKTKKQVRYHSDDFKRDIVGLVQGGKSVSAICDDYGLAKSLVYGWVSKLKGTAPRGVVAGLGDAERMELNRLRKEVVEVRRERDFLKKTAAYFARVRP